jgi:GDP-4-dehydro-6-deoxy-D-mannose reductase
LKVLITGAGGFVGRHLTNELSAAGMDLILTSEVGSRVLLPSGKSIPLLPCNISDRNALNRIFKEGSPDAVVHLAAVSHVVNAQNARETLSEVNIVGTHNVCAAAAGLDKKVSFLFVSTSLVYGAGSSSLSQSAENIVYDELSLPAPESAYGASKLAGEFITRSYASDKFRPFIVRPFNHIGPGQHPNFVCPSLASKIAMSKNGGTIKVGNLKTFRDFTDVRDIVRAYRLILEKEPSEDLFVVGSGKVVRIDSILESFIQISEKEVNCELDNALLRDIDPPRLCANPSRARNSLNWSTTYSLQDTLKDIYKDALRNNK